ncbi:hypothetical protein [Streptomyces violaceusniger]|uniref:Uncharacterized protein n=1 Tax=Streptomyces violaceusniger TaxID=68280 RepID=A0A4D4LDA5_STRVO|nr:hypothetical protein SVIO_101840 [Streptomyces violaceusniger]
MGAELLDAGAAGLSAQAVRHRGPAGVHRRHPVREAAGATAVRTTCAAVLAAGAEVDWDTWFPVRGRAVPLPAHPWQREHHLNGAPDWWMAGPGGGRQESGHHLLRDRLPTVEPTWRTPVEPSRHGWIGDHRVSG